jgi:hypothetical protein
MIELTLKIDPKTFMVSMVFMRLESAIEHSKGNALCHRQITQAFHHDDLVRQLAKFRGLL